MSNLKAELDELNALTSYVNNKLGLKVDADHLTDNCITGSDITDSLNDRVDLSTLDNYVLTSVVTFTAFFTMRQILQRWTTIL